jgi:hypothetical protein
MDPLCNIVKCQLCIVARSELALVEARPKSIFNLLEAERAVNARRSPLVDSRGQWASSTVEEAVGSCLRTPIATVQVLCALPRAEDSEAGHLLELVKIQAVTRREAKEATQGESPLVDEIVEGLLNLILKSQGTDPLCTRLKKELGIDIGCEGYSIG